MLLQHFFLILRFFTVWRFFTVQSAENPCAYPLLTKRKGTQALYQYLRSNLVDARGVALAGGLGQGWLWVPPALIHYQPVRLPSLIKPKEKTRPSACFSFGGCEGSRTPVRKPLDTAFYECSTSFSLSHALADGQALAQGNHLLHDGYNDKLAVHVHRWFDAGREPRYSHARQACAMRLRRC